METGDIVFFKSNSLISKAISYFTDSPYSHVALAVSSDEIIEADRFIKVRKRKLDALDVVEVRAMHLAPIQKAQLVYVAEKQLNKGYDYLSILKWFIRLLFKRDFTLVDNANRLICSELIDVCYQEIGIDLVPDRTTGDVLPSQLYTIKPTE